MKIFAYERYDRNLLLPYAYIKLRINDLDSQRRPMRHPIVYVGATLE